MGKVEKLVTQINTSFYDNKLSRDILIRSSVIKGVTNYDARAAEIDKECKKITENCSNTASLQDSSRYFSIAFSDYLDFKRNEKDEFIYKIDNHNGAYYISTGLYCGVVNFGDKYPQLSIETGLSDLFFKRILNFCCGIYADQYTSKNSTESESIYSLLIQYLYLISLRKVVSKAIPKRYVTLRDRGYDIKGNVDIEAYINNDLLSFDKKVTYTYSKRLEIQTVIDVLYTALSMCKISNQGGVLPNLIEYRNYLEGVYSGIRPSKKIINSIHKEKCFTNSLYSDYKRPVEYARVLIRNNDINSGGGKPVNGISGFLVDASFLWEMYLYNLMKLHLHDWDIEAQSVISFYDDTFYPKNNYPDFVLRNRTTGKIFILDAKFKKMTFDGMDVDNQDIRQLHSYSYYYHLTEGDNFAGAGLIYPTKCAKPEILKNVDHLFGLENSNRKFGVFAIKDPEASETMAGNEMEFINELKSFLE